MKKTLKINTKVIKDLSPYKDGFKDWQKHYNSFDGDILEFFCLEDISAVDKIWVAIKVLPRNIMETFVINCAFSAYDATCYPNVNAIDIAAAEYASYAATAAFAYVAYDTYATDVDYAIVAAKATAFAAVCGVVTGATHAAVCAQREYQVDALIWLIKEERRSYEENT